MAAFPDTYSKKARFYDWKEYATYAGRGAGFDHLWIHEFSDILLQVALAAQFVQIYTASDQRYYVSLTIPELAVDMKQLLKEGDEFDIFFDPRQRIERDEKTGEPLNKGRGWIAHVIKPDTIKHTGTHLATVSRRWFDSETEDMQHVYSNSFWHPNIKYLRVYTHLRESEKTLKTRIRAVRNASQPPPKLILVKSAEQEIEDQDALNEIANFEKGSGSDGWITDKEEEDEGPQMHYGALSCGSSRRSSIVPANSCPPQTPQLLSHSTSTFTWVTMSHSK